MPEWTKAQREAIECEAETILVSAAAGSGKSTVLTERILQRLMREEDPIELDEMLIVTFTRAAAAELKEKLSAALTGALAVHPDSARLARQVLSLSRARISTIHSFCFDLIRGHFESLGLSSSVRIAEENEGRLLRHEVMESVIGDCFDGAEEIPAFSALYDYFVTGKNDSAEEGLLRLYETLLQYPEGIDRLLTNAAQYEEAASLPFLATAWGKEAAKEVGQTLSYFRSLCRASIDALGAEEGYEKVCAVFSDELSGIDRLLRLLAEEDAAALGEGIGSFEFSRLTRAPASEEYETAKKNRDRFKKELKDLKKNALFTPEAETRESAKESAAFLRSLHAFFTRFDTRLTDEKKRRGLLDFADLERYALRLLTENGAPTETAKEVSAELREIYIDEYQDVNELQDAIFRAAAVHSRRFMVGDSKQSIYGFRGAVPELFAAYRQNPAVRTVFLQENFRSAPNLLAFDNAVCGYLFRHDSGRMPYEERDDLVPGLPSVTAYPVEVTLVSGEEEDGKPLVTEAAYVASRVAALLREGVKPGDITLLFRSPSTCSRDYEEALARAGIPCENREKHDFFENPQVLLYLCLLNCIDNPRRDLYLAGLLRSPLFGFSMEELVRIRSCADGSLYDALRAYAGQPEAEKARGFLEKLAVYRNWALSSPVDALVWRLLDDTDAFSLRVGDGTDGEQNRAKLLRLYEHARQFERGSFKGLNRFLRYLNDILESGEKMPDGDEGEESDAVHIMSIHSSKGLQFPVCFLCGCGKQFNREDLNRNLLSERTLGIAAKHNDESGFARLATPFHSAQRLRLHSSLLDEEMRLLYVALTRAKTRLFVTGRVKDPDAFLASCGEDGGTYRVAHSASYLQWILTALRASGFTDHRENVVRSLAETEEAGLTVPTAEETAEAAVPSAPDPSLLARLRERFAFRYPKPGLSSLPAKLTVSRLRPDLLDGGDEGTLDLSLPRPTDFAVPAFLAGKEATGADRGTATHLFMQFCDFDRVLDGGVEKEIARLVERQYLPAEIAPLIRREQLTPFFSSSLCRAMRVAQTLRREVRFNVNLPASEFSRDGSFDGEEVLVQGVIDCWFSDRDGNVTLLDYKTDAVPREVRGNREAEEAFLLSRHRNQLRYYRLALSKILCRPVSRVLLWSFALNRAITVE